MLPFNPLYEMKLVSYGGDEMNGGTRHEAESPRRRVSAVPSLQLAESSEPLVPIVFKGRGMCRVAGADSQRVYCFTANDPEQLVDAKEAEALLKTGLFTAGR